MDIEMIMIILEFLLTMKAKKCSIITYNVISVSIYMMIQQKGKNHGISHV